MVRYRRCGNDDVGVIFVFQTLPEDVHVQRAEESKSATLPECGRRLAGDLDAAVREAELKSEPVNYQRR